jgi:hypothetical protein
MTTHTSQCTCSLTQHFTEQGVENLEIEVMVLRSELGMIIVRLNLAAMRTAATQERTATATERSSVDDSDDPSAYSDFPCYPSHSMSANSNALSSEVYHYKCPFELPSYMKDRVTAYREQWLLSILMISFHILVGDINF